MAKYRYSVTVNGVPEDGRTIGYRYRSTACTLTCARGAAQLSFEMGTKKDIRQPDFFGVDLVKDAMRKMYLLHAMGFDGRLWIDTITVTCGDETAVYDSETPHFPFLSSMLTAKELKLPESWRGMDFLQTVLTQPKSVTDNDARYSCLFSFLAGASKHYEIERFTCYWTAMNAHYNYMHSRHAPQDSQRRGGRAGDSECISTLMQLLGCGGRLSSQRDRSEKFKTEYGAMKSCLRNYTMEELEQLYQELYALRTEPGVVPEGDTVMQEDLRSHLARCINRPDRPAVSAWGFLLLDYAYYMRCKYLHGNKTTILFTAFNDREVAAFRALNVFLGEYLKEAIPDMFREG